MLRQDIPEQFLMNTPTRTIFLLLAAVLVFTAGNARAEEDSKNRPHFYQPGSGYEQEPEYKFTGTISKLPEGGTSGTWVIDQRLILVTPMTTINEEKGKIAAGAAVEVRGLLRGIDFMAVAIAVTTGSSKKTKEEDKK